MSRVVSFLETEVLLIRDEPLFTTVGTLENARTKGGGEFRRPPAGRGRRAGSCGDEEGLRYYVAPVRPPVAPDVTLYGAQLRSGLPGAALVVPSVGEGGWAMRS